MKVAVFNTKSYDRQFLEEANQKYQHDIVYFEAHLTMETCKLAYGFEGICIFVNDILERDVLKLLAENGTRLIVLRCAGFNNIDLDAAHEFGFTIIRVPAYSPHGVAEHAVAIMLALNRKIYRSHNRIREGNFSLEGLMGFEMYGKTMGIMGTGKIGQVLANIMTGFGMNIVAFDKYVNPECEAMGVRYCSVEELFAQSDIISLHLPLHTDTHHIINQAAIDRMKDNVMLINTSRGGLIDTKAAIAGLKSGKIGSLGLDVYEVEEDLFFEDLSGELLQDDVFARLLTFPNVVITGHQAFFNDTALKNIADMTVKNIADFRDGTIDRNNVVTVEFKS